MKFSPHPDTAMANVYQCEALGMLATVSNQGWISLEREGGQSHLLIHLTEWPEFANLIHGLNTLLNLTEDECHDLA